MKNTFLRKTLVVFAALTLGFGLVSCDSDGGESDIPVKRIALNQKNLELTSGESFQLTCTFTPSNATNQNVKWTVKSGSDYAKVSKTGLVTVTNTGNSPASAVVTCMAQDGSNAKASCSITVNLALPPEFSAADKFADGFDLIMAGPAFDSSTSAVITWHSTSETCTLEYTGADGDTFDNTIENLHGTRTTCDWSDNADYFKYRVELIDLTPASKYKYHIIAGNTTSKTCNFKTSAADDTAFNFMVLSDLHTPKGSSGYIANVDKVIGYAESALSSSALSDKKISFCIFNGDMVNKGQTYQQWNYWGQKVKSLGNCLYAFVEGNHDYYPYKDKSRVKDAWYLDCVAIPYATDTTHNAGIKTDIEPSNFYFRYGNVLVVCLDTMMMEATGMKNTGHQVSFAAQQAWFREVVTKNTGYDYLVVTKHYTFINGDDPSDYGDYETWYPIFDEYGVDFAIGSDEHTYSRTKWLKNNAVVEHTQANPQGTVYITTPQLEGSLSGVTKESGSHKISAFNSTGGQCGGIYFTVDSEKMVMHLISSNTSDIDTCTAYKKNR